MGVLHRTEGTTEQRGPEPLRSGEGGAVTPERADNGEQKRGLPERQQVPRAHQEVPEAIQVRLPLGHQGGVEADASLVLFFQTDKTSVSFVESTRSPRTAMVCSRSD